MDGNKEIIGYYRGYLGEREEWFRLVGSSGYGKKRLDLEYILKVQSGVFVDKLYGGYERMKIITNNFQVFGLRNQTYGGVIESEKNWKEIEKI